MRVRVFYHDNCFDGACSASLFTRFHRECIAPEATYEYHALVHRAGALFDNAAFAGDENAIVDFKYSPSPRVTWWFDHHLSAFLSAEDHAVYERGLGDPASNFRDRRFFDPKYTSCTSFIADTAAARFGFDAAPVASLVHWANIVDGALYESAQAAVEMREPAMRLTLAIESGADPGFVPRLIPLLTAMPLEQVLEPREERGTIFFDIADRELEGYNKFIPYYLCPQATYSVGLSRSSFRTKVAVGTNPWTTADPQKLVNLAAICERYGGGGHARVGAVSFPPDRYEEAHEAARVIAEELCAAQP